VLKSIGPPKNKTLNGGFSAKGRKEFRNALFYSARGKNRQKNLSSHPHYKTVKTRGYKKNSARFLCCSGKYEEVNSILYLTRNLIWCCQDRESKQNMMGLKHSANETNKECIQNSDVETSWGDTNFEDGRWNIVATCSGCV
jgi:hypothetical protein